MAKVNKPLSALTNEELVQRKQKMSGILAGIGLVYVLLIAVSFFLIIKQKKFSVQAMMPLIVLPALIPSFIVYGQIQAELKKRKGS